MIRFLAIFTHFFTALGAILAFLALEAASRHNWAEMMIWLVIAFVVDGVDGPMARKFDVKKNAPEWDGVLLDLIIDYLTYVLIPAYAFWQSGMLGQIEGGIVAGIICYLSVIYFADTRMKTKDCSFAGFPGCWNMVVVVFFAIQPPAWVIWFIVIVLSGAMFTPLKFVHPTRTQKWRSFSLPIAILWTGLAGISAWMSFDAFAWVNYGLIFTSAYLLLAGILQEWKNWGRA